RKTSISFNPKVTLDSGHEFDLHEPLPKPMDDSYDDATMPESTSKVVQHLGEMRHSFAQPGADDVAARDVDLQIPEHMSSLTSGTTASPIQEEIRTPPDVPEHSIASPLQSPSISQTLSRSGSGFWPVYSQNRSRTSTFRSERSGGSLRRSNRRSSTRSMNSSMSPAASYLSGYSRRDDDPAPVEPDSEGQEIALNSGYFIGRQVGSGGFSVVREVTTMECEKTVKRAVKIVRKQIAGKSDQENDKVQHDFEQQISIWRFLKHRYILPLIAVYDTPFATFCITRLIPSGTLYDLIYQRRKERPEAPGLPAKVVRRYIYQLASALRYMHEDVRAVHRDVKIENCLLDRASADEDGNILLCDFGMADFITNESRPEPSPLYPEASSPNNTDKNGGEENNDNKISFAGSLEYASPELINSRHALYSPAADVWALGVVLFALITAKLPWSHSFQPRLAVMIISGKWDEEVVRGASCFKFVEKEGADGEGEGEGEVDEENLANAMELLRGCLDTDPETRWTVGEVLECRWL
ncbi:kinase-like protein, partial [Aulographum hederae CBS 113979]